MAEDGVPAALRDEIKSATSQISDFLRSSDQLLVLSVASVAALATYGSRADGVSARVVLLTVPVIITAISSFAMRAVTNIVALGAYRARLEQLLAEELQVGNTFWESQVAAQVRGSVPHVFAQIMFGVLIAGGYAVGVWSAVTLHTTLRHTQPVLPGWGLALILGAYGLLAVGLLCSHLRGPRIELNHLALRERPLPDEAIAED